MAFLFRQFFLLAVDLMLGSTLSCFFYAFVCLIIALLICFVIFLSFGVVKKMEKDIKGRAIVILVSNSSIGRTFTRNLDEAGFKVSAMFWPPKEKWATVLKEECSPKMNVSQIHMTEDEYQKTVKNFIESHLSLKGVPDVKKKISALMWEEQEENKKEFSERKTTWIWKNVVLFPGGLDDLDIFPSHHFKQNNHLDNFSQIHLSRTALRALIFMDIANILPEVYFFALLFLPVNYILVFLKKKILHFTSLLKLKNRQHEKQHVE